MIGLKEYLTALQASWVKRVGTATDDLWKFDLYQACKNDVTFADPALVSKEDHPVLHTIATSFRDFKVNFLCENKNFWKSKLCFNPLLCNEEGEPLINDRWWGGNLPRYNISEVTGITMADIADNWNLKRLDEIVDSTNVQLSLASYMRLAGIVNAAKNKWGKNFLSILGQLYL
jgi:hypothetical protein